MPIFFLRLTEGEARSAFFHDECAHAFEWAGFFIGGNENDFDFRFPTLVLNTLVPLRTQKSPSFMAVLVAPPTSVPALGSVRPKAPIFSPLRPKVSKTFAFALLFRI